MRISQRRRLAVIFQILIASQMTLTAGSLQDPGSLQQIPGTTLRIALPPEWEVLAAAPLGSPQLRSTGRPEYALMIGQTNSRSQGHTCMDFLGSMQSLPGIAAAVVRRPGFIPEAYFGSSVQFPEGQLTCLSTGSGLVSVMIQLRQGEPRPELVSTVLAAIAEAALKQSNPTSAPASLKLPVLGIQIPVRQGSWGIRTATDQWGTNDILGRVAQPGSNELHITPFVNRAPGRCESLMVSPSFSRVGARYVNDVTYAGARWFSGAMEQFPPPFRALQAYACRNIGQDSVLLARIDYEKNAVSEQDSPVIRQMLDDIGDAMDKKLVGK